MQTVFLYIEKDSPGTNGKLALTHRPMIPGPALKLKSHSTERFE